MRAETGLAIDVQRLRDLRRACRQASQPHGRAWFAPAVSGNTEQVFTLELPAETALTIHSAEHVEYGWFDCDVAVAKAASWSNREVILDLAKEPRQADGGNCTGL